MFWLSYDYIFGISKAERYYEDKIDGLHDYASRLLLWIAVTAYFNVTLRSPLSCWTPDHFHFSWTEVVHNLCYLQGTAAYHVPIQSAATQNVTTGMDHGMELNNYYAWMPLVYAMQSLLYYAPGFCFACFFKFKHGRKLKNLLCHSKKATSPQTTAFARPRHILKCVALFKDVCRSGKQLHCFRIPSHLAFFCVKIAYIANDIFQLVMLSTLTGSGQFHSTGICNIQVRALSNIHRFTLQCVKNFSALYEYVALFLWYVVLVLLILSTLSISYWLTVACVGKMKATFVQNCIADCDFSSTDCADQICNGLSTESLFIMKMLPQDDAKFSRAILAAVLEAEEAKERLGEKFQLLTRRCRRPHIAHGKQPPQAIERHLELEDSC